MPDIFITGDRGSLGTLLKRRLKEEGHSVRVQSDTVLRIEQKEYFDSIPNPESIDVLFHLAAKSFVPYSWKNPPAFIEANVLGTTNVLHFCNQHHIKLVYISSYAYGIPQYLPIDENHPVSAVNPYGLSKIMGEELCQFYGKNFDLKYTIVRPFNIYGPSDNSALLIPEIITQIKKRKTIEVRDLTPKRDYVFINDVIDFLCLSLTKFENKVYNIGSGKGFSVAEIIQACQTVFETNLLVTSDKTVRKNEIPETRCDYTKANEDFGWKPKTTLEEGIKQIKETNSIA